MRISDWSSDVCSSDLEVLEALKEQAAAQGWTPGQNGKEFGELEYDTMRAMVLATKVRVDRRDLTTVRPISISNSVLPRTHGSALFTRGETRATVGTNLGAARAGPGIDAGIGEEQEKFQL